MSAYLDRLGGSTSVSAISHLSVGESHETNSQSQRSAGLANSFAGTISNLSDADNREDKANSVIEFDSRADEFGEQPVVHIE